MGPNCAPDIVFACFEALTVLHFGAQLALLGILKQRLVTAHLFSCFTARLVEQSAIPAWRRASK